MKYSRDEIGIKKFGKRLKQIRLSKNMTQEELAWEAGIEPMQVSRIERGIINTGISQVFLLSKALRVSPKDLFDFE